jgi:hypothetical protein
MLLELEAEFRIILPTIELLEVTGGCHDRVKLLLQKEAREESLDDDELKLITEIDRTFRFFYLCIVLDEDLAVTTKALRYAYYHYLAILAEPSAPELSVYLNKYYRRLSRWLLENKISLRLLRETGKWKSQRRIAWEEAFSTVLRVNED